VRPCRSRGPRRIDPRRPLRAPVALVGAAAATAALIWAAILGPARDDPSWVPVADYAIAHPAQPRRIVTYAGVGSTSTGAPRALGGLNGWLGNTRHRSSETTSGGPARGETGSTDALRRIHAGSGDSPRADGDPPTRVSAASAGVHLRRGHIWSGPHIERRCRILRGLLLSGAPMESLPGTATLRFACWPWLPRRCRRCQNRSPSRPS